MRVTNVTRVPAEHIEVCHMCGKVESLYLAELSDGKSMMVCEKDLEQVHQICNMINYADVIDNIIRGIPV